MMYAELKNHIDRFYADKSRSAEETLDALEELRDEIGMMIDALIEDID